ncbi:MAG: MFS transporter [Thermoguttaceae bacterium]
MPDTNAQSAKPDPYALWRNPNYRYYAGSWFLITFSRRVEFAAVSFYLVTLYGDPQHESLLLGILGLVLALPVILLSIAGGQLADRFNRLRLMTLTFSLGILSAAGLLVVAMLGGNATVWFYVLLGIGTVGWALGNPARQAMLPSLISTDLFSIGVAWNSSAFYIASATGLFVGGAMLDMFQTMAPIFALVLLCRIAAIAAISRIRYRPVVHAEQAVSWQSLVAGIRFVWNTPLILATITLDLFAVLLGGVTYLVPVYAAMLHVGGTGYGVLMAGDMIGAICMALILAHRPPLRRAGVTLLWAVAGFGAATIIFGISQWFWLSLLMMLLIGALDNISVVVRHTLVQMLTPDEMRGRVSAVNSIFIVASNDLGGMESGLTAWLFGPVASAVGGGIGTILVVLAALRIWPQILKIGSLASIRPAAVEEPDRDV